MTKRVALLFNISKSYDRQIAQAVVDYGRSHGWAIYLEERPEERLPAIENRDWDGVIADLDDHEFVKSLRKIKKYVPIVGCGGLKPQYRRGLAVSTVDSNESEIAKSAIGHLKERGYRSFAFCSIELDTPDAWLDERRQAFVVEAKRQRLGYSVYTHMRKGRASVDTMLDKLAQWLKKLPRPCGVMACNDPFARHVLEACRRAAIAVPDELGVIGVDNSDLFCELTEPPLTSMQLDTQRIGHELGRQLQRSMNGDNAVERIEIPPRDVVVRASTDLAFSENGLVASAIRYIRQSLGKPLSVKGVCRELQISRSKLDAEFQETLGRSVHDEIARRRLEQATSLLRDPSLTILEISQRCGFSSSAYFIAVFKKQHRLTPKEFRER
jgi:LacI family transcriptional regulator